jgi:hypothetical protein
LADGNWHHAEVTLEYPHCLVALDGVPYIDADFPTLPAPFRAHIGLSASTGLCYSEHIIDNLVIRNPRIPDTIVVADTAAAPLDSRPPDSFCNWGSDNCFMGQVCYPAISRIICGPCGGFTGCYDQIVQFSIFDPLGFDIDTMRTYFTVIVSHIAGDADTFALREPSANVQFSCVSGCDTVMATVRGFSFASGDSVIVSLDSLYNERGCITR